MSVQAGRAGYTWLLTKMTHALLSWIMSTFCSIRSFARGVYVPNVQSHTPYHSTHLCLARVALTTLKRLQRVGRNSPGRGQAVRGAGRWRVKEALGAATSAGEGDKRHMLKIVTQEPCIGLSELEGRVGLSCSGRTIFICVYDTFLQSRPRSLCGGRSCLRVSYLPSPTGSRSFRTRRGGTPGR